MGRQHNRRKTAWITPRSDARRVREWLYRKAITSSRAVNYFFRFLRGNVEGLNRAPAVSKYALFFFRGRSPKQFAISPLPTSSEVWQMCQEAHSTLGVWPISFSYPRHTILATEEQGATICPVFPGHRYRFSQEDDYLDFYRSYAFALTHKKAGWDCFRHLEILYTGSTPFMPDATLIPRFTMVHYPKQFFAEVAGQLIRSSGYLDMGARQNLNEYFNRHLTSDAMARYLLRAAAVPSDAKILFVDSAAPHAPDYQSILTLIGLKQFLGKRVHVANPIGYLYSDWTGESDSLYGRGFGYSGVLEPIWKNDNEIIGEPLNLNRSFLAQFGVVIVGSVTRNPGSVEKLRQLYPAEKTIYIHGEDEGPSRSEMRNFVSSGAKLFVRELSDDLSSS